MSETGENEELEKSETQEIKGKSQPNPNGSTKGGAEIRSVPKVKRERTEKQKEHFARLSELNKKRYEEKRLIKEEEEAKRKRELEKKIIDKAIKIKKKIIKKEMLLEELSDDETPIQKPKAKQSEPVKKERSAPIQTEPPKYVSKFNYVR